MYDIFHFVQLYSAYLLSRVDKNIKGLCGAYTLYESNLPARLFSSVSLIQQGRN
jgi:hypothetical protein